MATSKKDPTEPMRHKASRYAGVDEGTACTQSAFKRGKRAFLYVGMQGGWYKAMFQLDKSLPEAARLAEREPDRFQVGSTAWVTARFAVEQSMPTKLWEKWLDESYALSVTGTSKSMAKKKTKRKGATQKAKRGHPKDRDPPEDNLGRGGCQEAGQKGDKQAKAKSSAQMMYRAAAGSIFTSP